MKQILKKNMLKTDMSSNYVLYCPLKHKTKEGQFVLEACLHSLSNKQI